MPKTAKPHTLTIPQLLVLTTAASRPDHMVMPLPEGVRARGASQQRLLTSLLNLMLVIEVATENATLSWRTSEDGLLHALMLTAAGMAAVSTPAAVPQPAEPTCDEALEVALVASEGTAAESLPATAAVIDDEPGDHTMVCEQPVAALPAAKAPAGKLGQVLTAVQADTGATVGELAALTGWLPHTTRAALTRLKQRGYPITLVRGADRKAYRLDAPASV